MSGYSKINRRDKSSTYKLTAAILGVLCALFFVTIGVFSFSEMRTPESLDCSVSDKDFQDNVETYYEDMTPVPYSSYIAAGNQS